MKRYRIFAVDENNMIKFTKEELESILDETYNDGFSDGKLAAKTTLIRYPTNDPGSTGNNPLNPCITWMGPNDVPCTSDSNITYTTVATSNSSECATPTINTKGE